MSDHDHWNGLSLLDALRPEPLYEVEYALLTSYSVDLVALVAVLLALSGRDNEQGSGTQVDFAQTIEDLRGRVKLLTQSGRMQAPGKNRKVLVLLDQFVQEMSTAGPDAQANDTTSFHSKLALVKYIPQRALYELEPADNIPSAKWRFWISSRNLTRDMSWDSGLLLVGTKHNTKQELPGFMDAATTLFDWANIPNVDAKEALAELQYVDWQAPEGMAVERIDLYRKNGLIKGLPQCPPELHELIVISPFLDQGTVAALGSWGDSETTRSLLSSHPDLIKVATRKKQALKGYQDRIWACVPPECSPLELNVDEPDHELNEEEVLSHNQGLHAKLIYANSQGGAKLWLGSANATSNGWDGKNTELVVQLSVNAPEIAEGLNALIEDTGRKVDPPELATMGGDLEEDSPLEIARDYVVRHWDAVQKGELKRRVLCAETLPHPPDQNITLLITLLGGDLKVWPRDSHEVVLPPLTEADETELVLIELRMDDETPPVRWLQKAPLDMAMSSERDRHVLARHLETKVFLEWVRSLLNNARLSDGGGDFWGDRQAHAQSNLRSDRPENLAPTLEEILKAFSRNDDSLFVVDRKINAYLSIMTSLKQEQKDDVAEKALQDFTQVWATIRKEFVRKRA